MELSTLSLAIDFVFLFITLKFFYFVYKNFLRKPYNLLERYGNDSWALITGATDGIGKAFCQELAKRGINVILVSRSLDKLKRVENEIKTEYPNIKTECIAFDFEKRITTEDYIETFSPVKHQYDISILINNVGLAFNRYFLDTDIHDNHKMININCVSQLLLTQIFLEKFVKRNERSAVLNVSSISALTPFPKFAVYSATKIFSYYLTQAISEELKNEKIDFMSLKPGYVSTNMSQKWADGLYVISANQCAVGALNNLGYEHETYGHWSHKIQGYVLSWVPSFILSRALTWGKFIKNEKLN